MSDLHGVELKNRIVSGWAAFSSFKSELCCTRYPLQDRIRLFEAVITPRVLYGTASWTLTKNMERLLRSARRNMLRKMFGGGRKSIITADGDRTLENWVDYVKRATRKAEDAMLNFGAQDWVDIH